MQTTKENVLDNFDSPLHNKKPGYSQDIKGLSKKTNPVIASETKQSV